MKCQSCNYELLPGALFCGECGSPVNRNLVTPSQPAPTAAAETAQIQRPEAGQFLPGYVEEQTVAEFADAGAAVNAPPVAPSQSAPSQSAPSQSAPPQTAPAHSQPPHTAPAPFPSGDDDESIVPVEETVLAGAHFEDSTVIVNKTPAVVFTITLNNGDKVRLTHSALVGRMPTPGDGELFEYLVIIQDPGRSVSKTHLEVGVDGDKVWVMDRNSGNGSIIKQPGVVPLRAQPGQKYEVVRGTRIDLGDQFITIS